MLSWMNPVNVSAITLGSSSFTIGTDYYDYGLHYSSIEETIASINLKLGFGEMGMQMAPVVTWWAPDPSVKLFDIGGLGTNSIGKTYYADISSDEYDYVIDLLTNGKGEYVTYALLINDGAFDCSWDFLDIYSGSGVDFEGYSIDNISLIIDGLNLDSAILAPDGTVLYLKYGWDVTVSIHSKVIPVPEPATILMLIAGIITMASLGIKYKSGIVELGSCAAG